MTIKLGMCLKWQRNYSKKEGKQMHLPTTTTTTKQPAQYVFEESCFFIPVLIIVSCDAVWVNILNVYAAMLIFR
jgi:hypothetical protein